MTSNLKFSEWMESMKRVDISDYMDTQRILRPSNDNFEHFRNYMTNRDDKWESGDVVYTLPKNILQRQVIRSS